MLRWRIISAIVIIAGFAGVCWLDAVWPLAGRAGLWLLPLAIAVTILASTEVASLVYRSPSTSHVAALATANAAIVAVSALPIYHDRFFTTPIVGQLGWTWLAFTVAMVLAFAQQMRNYRTGEQAISRIGRTVLALAYVGGLISFLVALRTYGTPAIGLLAFVSLVVVVKFSDIGAYAIGRTFGGRFFGRARLAPVLSPKKTFEGAAGAIIFACLGSWLSLAVAGPRLIDGYTAPAWWAWGVCGVAIALAGMFGDLAESLLKREAGAKDSSSWLPGLGGVLDLMDSILFAGPVAFVIWVSGALG